jgi:hypothetical protein
LQQPRNEFPLAEWGKQAVSWSIQGLTIAHPPYFRLTKESSKGLLKLVVEFSEQLAPFADVIAFSLGIAYRQFQELEPPTPEVFLATIQLPGITSLGRIAFISAIVRRADVSDSLFGSYEFCESWIATLTLNETLAIFSNGFYDVTTLLYVFLYSDSGFRILDEIADLPQGSLGFFSELWMGVTRAIRAELMTSSAFYSLFIILPRITAPFALEMLLPLFLPELRLLITRPIVPQQALETVLQILQDFQSRIPPDWLSEYANIHRLARRDRQDSFKTVTDETEHPYQNNMNRIRSWDFDGAYSIRITFDEQCNSEHNCDYLEIFKSPERMDKDRVAKISGGRNNWKTIVVAAHHITFRFYSDGSVTEWGYRATITAFFRRPLPLASPNFAADGFNLLQGILSEKFAAPWEELPG